MSIERGYFVPHPPLIVPEVGKGQEKTIQKTIDAYEEIAKEIAKLKPDTIIISSPHSTLYADYFHISSQNFAIGNLSGFGAKDVSFEVEYDEEFIDLIHEYANKNNFPTGTLGQKDQSLDHGTMIPLYFINKYYQSYKLIRISPSGLPLIRHYNIGRMINSIVPDDKKVIWIASGDLSHKLIKDGPYGLAKEGPMFDEKVTGIIKTTEFDNIFRLKPKFTRKAAECGLGSLTMLCGCFDGYNVESRLLSYEGPFGVGYSVASFKKLDKNIQREFSMLYSVRELQAMEITRSLEDEYVRLARQSLEYYIKNNKTLPFPNDLSDDLLDNKAGVFVSLHKGDDLRGCIGTISPTTNSIANEIIQNAISAGTKDYRFNPVQEAELPKIKYSVDVLKQAERIESKEQLDIHKYGVIVRSGYKSGLLLPNIDGVDSVDEQIEIAKRKAGINKDEEYTLERFEVIRHH
jgi:AmmeMemoRadiSam system protein A